MVNPNNEDADEDVLRALRLAEADEYLYVEARAFEGNKRKQPVQAYKNGAKNPDPEDFERTRSTENGYMLTYGETDKSGETPYLIAGRKGPGFVVDIDIDTDPDEHEEVFQGDADALNHPDGALHFGSPNGGHTVLKSNEKGGFSDFKEAVGIDFNGDIEGNAGLVTSPFHHPDYEIRNIPTSKRDFAPFFEDATRLNYLFGGTMAEKPAVKYPATANVSHGGNGNASASGRTSSNYDGPEWFGEDTAREALEHVEAGTGYRPWLDIIHALADHFEECVAERLAREWSQRSVRYDDEADKLIRTIVQGNDSNRARKVTIGTLISRARSNGWVHNPAEYVPILPEPPAAKNAGRTWGPLEAEFAGGKAVLTTDEARQKTFDRIRDIFERAENALVEGLPTLGKSFSAVKAAGETDIPVSILTSRGRREQYGELQAVAEEHGLKSIICPSVKEDCGCFTGKHGEDVQAKVEDWYRRGASGREIHMFYESVFGAPIPCDGKAGDRCSYKAKWQFDADDYDVILGHYLHGHVKSVTSGRTVVMDEYPGECFEEKINGERLAGSVTRYLKNHHEVPFEGFADLIEHRDSPNRSGDVDDALEALEAGDGVESDGEAPIRDSDGHADAAAAVYTMLASERYENGRERAHLPGPAGLDTGVYDPDNQRMKIRRTPDLRYARNVVALDGTPEKQLWEDVQEKKLNHYRILTDDERRSYLRDTMAYRFIRTTPFVKSYNSEQHVQPDEDGALLEGIRARHGEKPALITTFTAETAHQRAGLYHLNDEYRVSRASEYVSKTEHYGNIRGSNRFKTDRLGCVIGTNHYGDDYIKDRAAFLGADVDRKPGGGKGADLEYVEANADPGDALFGVGDMIHDHITTSETFQAALRFGRDGNGATVYLHTSALPDLLEDIGAIEDGRIVNAYSDGEQQVLEALDAMNLEGTGGPNADGVTTASEVADGDGVEVGVRRVREILNDLESRGFIRRRDPPDRRGLVWFDPGGTLATAPERGHAALPNPPERKPELTADAGVRGAAEDAEVSPMGYYTWNFRHSQSNHLDPPASVESSKKVVANNHDRGGSPAD